MTQVSPNVDRRPKALTIEDVIILFDEIVELADRWRDRKAEVKAQMLSYRLQRRQLQAVVAECAESTVH